MGTNITRDCQPRKVADPLFLSIRKRVGFSRRYYEAGRAGLPAGFRWTQPDREAAWTRLEELDCATLTEPLCWLPEIGLYVTSLHPNDLRNGPTSPDDWSGGWFNWSDIITVRELWQEAQGLDRKVTRFIDWAADRTNLETIFALITGISATLPD